MNAMTATGLGKATLDLDARFALAIPQTPRNARRRQMGRSILLWLIGVPIPIIILLALFWR